MIREFRYTKEVWYNIRMAAHAVFDYEDRGQRMRHRGGMAGAKPADTTVPCAR